MAHLISSKRPLPTVTWLDPLLTNINTDDESLVSALIIPRLHLVQCVMDAFVVKIGYRNSNYVGNLVLEHSRKGFKYYVSDSIAKWGDKRGMCVWSETCFDAVPNSGSNTSAAFIDIRGDLGHLVNGTIALEVLLWTWTQITPRATSRCG